MNQDTQAQNPAGEAAVAEAVDAPTAETQPQAPAEAEAGKSEETTASVEVVSPAAESPAAESSEAPAPTDDDAKPSERILIGTQREEEGEAATDSLKPKPVHVVTEGDATDSAPKGNYPPPNVRTAPTAEEEAELESMMGGSSVSDVLDSNAAAAPVELAADTKLKGKVTRVHGDSVFIDLGEHRQGIVPLKQFEPKGEEKKPAAAEATAESTSDQPAAEPTAEATAEAALPEFAPAVDSEIELVVVGLNAEEGVYDLKLPLAAVEVGNWDEVEAGQTVEVTITGKNKGGLECKVSGIRAFMPMGQISIYRVENPEEYVGQKMAAVITEANRSKRNLILSHRAVMERERNANREKLLAELAPGQIREGVVRSLRDFGAFVDLGGVDGMVHVSKLSWERIGHPKEVLSEGQQIKVKIEKIDKESGKIALSYREAAENPWDKAEEKYAIGSAVKGKVSKLMDFGAFVRLEPGVEGLIHISEIDYKRVHRTSDVLSEGQEVETKVLSVDKQKQRIALSLKALMTPPPAPEPKEPEVPDMPEVSEEEQKARQKRNKNLKGGISTPSGGEKFGLKW